MTKRQKNVCMKLNFFPKKGTAVVKKPHLATRLHPCHGLAIQVSVTSTSRNLGSRIAHAEKEVKSSNIWTIFRHLASNPEMTEDEMVALMDLEIPGLGQVACVFGTHQGPEGREENVWTILEFFMNVHVGLQRSPRLAWRDQKLRKEVLRLASIYGSSIGSI